MGEAFLGGGLWFLVFSPLYFFIAASALRYNTSRRKPPAETVEIFLSGLGFPLNKLYVQSRYNFITQSSRRTEAADLLNSRPIGDLLALIVLGSCSLLMTVLFTLVMLQSGDIAAGAFWTVIQFICLFRSFFFGYQVWRQNR